MVTWVQYLVSLNVKCSAWCYRIWYLQIRIQSCQLEYRTKEHLAFEGTLFLNWTWYFTHSFPIYPYQTMNLFQKLICNLTTSHTLRWSAPPPSFGQRAHYLILIQLLSHITVHLLPNYHITISAQYRKIIPLGHTEDYLQKIRHDDLLADCKTLGELHKWIHKLQSYEPLVFTCHDGMRNMVESWKNLTQKHLLQCCYRPLNTRQW